MRVSFVKVFVATIVFAACAHADVLTISGQTDQSKIKDTSIFGSFVSNSGGGSPGFFTGRDANGRLLRGLIQFDLSAIPASATISNVQLTLTLGQVAGAGGGSPDTTPRQVDLHRVTASWGEGTAGNTSTTFTGTGNGFAASTGDATWNARMFNTTNWSVAGGDFDSTISANQTIGTTVSTLAAPVTYMWSSSTMVSDVQGWINNPSTNFGWLIMHNDETGSTTSRGFWSREATSTSVSDPSFRPMLQVTYSATPEPVSAVPLLAATILLRRQRSHC